MPTQPEKSFVVCKASFYHARCPHISEPQPSLAFVTKPKHLAENVATIKTSCRKCCHHQNTMPSPQPCQSCSYSIHLCHLHLPPKVQLVDPDNAPIYPSGEDDVAQLTIFDAWYTTFINFQTKKNCNIALHQCLTDFIDLIYLHSLKWELWLLRKEIPWILWICSTSNI